MDDIFDLIKSRVDIVHFIEAETGVRAVKTGSNTYRINPCPFCHHNDCFTIYPEDNSFNCFSCRQAGDTVSFERLHQGLENNLGAAKSITNKVGISPDDDSIPFKAKQSGTLVDKAKTMKKPVTDEALAMPLRKLVSEFYHRELLENKKALEHQAKKRGHSIDVLKKFKVGYAGKESPIKYVKQYNYTVEDLVNIGIMRKAGKGFQTVVPDGTFVYPHMIKDEVVYFSLKHSDKKKSFQVKKQYAGEGWLCFNQDAFKSDEPVIIVEGENDLLSVVDKTQELNVIATLGNFNTSNILTYIKKNSKGKIYYLCFDRDRAGQGYVDKYSHAIIAGGGEARIIAIPEPHKDIDDILKTSEKPGDVLKSLMDNAVISRKIDNKKGEGHGATTEESSSDRYHFDSFTVLGELEDDRIVFESNDIRKLYIVPLKDITLEKLCQIGGPDIRKRVARSIAEIQPDSNMVHHYDLRKHIILEARKNQMGPLRWIGQGMTFLEDDRLLIVNGEIACVWYGTKFENYDSALIGNRLIDRRSASKWIDLELLKNRVLEMNHAKAKEIIMTALQLIRQWRFQGDFDEALVTGFLLAQMVQSIWNWRPHLWLTGPQGSGKTLLINLFEDIGGKLSRRFEGSSLTEAGFRQSLKHDFCLPLIDEFEKSQAREQIISYLRSAGRGGKIIKGTPGQETIEYDLKHMVLVASIETGLTRAAEKTRFLVVEMQKDPARNPHFPSFHEMEKIRLDFFAFSIWASLKTKAIVNQVGKISGFDSRLVEAFAVPFSMICIADADPLESLKKIILGILEDRKNKGDDDTEEDEITLLNDILSSVRRVEASENEESNIYTDRSIRWLLNQTSPFHEKDLEACGIKKCDGGVFFASQPVERHLLQNTTWKGMSITRILQRLPCAQKTQRRLDGHALKGVWLPEASGLFGKLGIETKDKDSDDLF